RDVLLADPARAMHRICVGGSQPAGDDPAARAGGRRCGRALRRDERRVAGRVREVQPRRAGADVGAHRPPGASGVAAAAARRLLAWPGLYRIKKPASLTLAGQVVTPTGFEPMFEA